MNRPLKIALVVQGRFHAFDFARPLIRRGHSVTLFTNYPGWAVERFGVDRRHVRSFVSHGILVRAIERLGGAKVSRFGEPYQHRLFGRWAAARLSREGWDIIHCFTGVAEEILRTPGLAGASRQLLRGSAHIRVQDRLLREEEERTGRRLERPSPWMIAREEREYLLADTVVVLSSFARASFRDQGLPDDRLSTLPLGVETAAFRPGAAVVEERCRRILSGEPLRVLFTGTLSLQKGMWDLAQIARSLAGERFQFRLVGSPAPELGEFLPQLARVATLVPRQPQHELPRQYAENDIFLFPTIQDGFAVVLTQALAGALPVLTTTNCSGPDVVAEGETGWVLPIRDPEAFVERLRWCDAHRPQLAAMVRRSYEQFTPRSWDEVAADFERLCGESLDGR